LNYVLLGAVLQAATGQSWDALVRERVMRPLATTHSNTDHDSARRDGMTALHRMWFGVPVAQQTQLLPGFAPTGSLVASANDMARYLRMLLAGGDAPAGRVLSPQGVAQLLAPGSPPARATLLSAEFAFRYGEGWFVGPFGVAADARWHLGNLASFAAWMVLLPESKQAVVMLINANTELPLGEVNAVMSRLPIGVVNLLHEQAAPQGPSLREAYRPFNTIVSAALVALAALAWWAWRARAAWPGVSLAVVAAALLAALYATGLRPALLAAFAPDLSLVLAAAAALLCWPFAWRMGRSVIRRAAPP
jgi:CubicO group peptidase (beta-lactamase class C family)